MTFDDVLAYGLTLADTIRKSYYGTPSLKTGGRAFASVGRDPRSFVMMIDLDTVEMLKETGPETYWQTRHYVGWPNVLVRLDTTNPARVCAMINKAYGWARTRSKPRPGTRGKP